MHIELINDEALLGDAEGASEDDHFLIRKVHAFLEGDARINFGVLRGDELVSPHILETALGALTPPISDEELRHLTYRHLKSVDLMVSVRCWDTRGYSTLLLFSHKHLTSTTE